MPTVIDSLIVQLGLNTQGFTQGQQQAVQQLRKFQQQAQQVGQTTGGVANQINKFFHAVQHPIQNLAAQFAALSTQAHQTGGVIGHATGVAAAGLGALTAAGLGAYAAIKAVQGVAHTLTSTIGSTSAVARMAQWFGGPGATPELGGPGVASWLSRFAGAAHAATHADPNQVMESLFGIQQDIQALYAGTGDYTERLQRLARLEITSLGSGSFEDIQRIMGELADRIRGMDPARAQAMLQGVLPREAIQFLQTGRAGINQAVQNQIDLTRDQEKAARDAERAVDNLERTWTGFVRTMETLAVPGLISVISTLRRWLQELQESPAAINRMKLAIEALAAVLGIGLIGALNKVLVALGPFGILIRGIAAALAVIEGGFWLREKIPQKSDEWQRDVHKDLSGQAPSLLNDFRNRVKGWINSLSSSLGFNTPEQEGDIRVSPGEQYAWQYITQKESGHKDVLNDLYGQPGRTASGYAQILESNWKQYAPLAGIDTSKYPIAKGTPEELQEKVFVVMSRLHPGFRDWVNFSGTPYGGSLSPAEAARLSNFVYGGGAKGGGSNTVNNNTNHDTDVNIGTLTVTAPGPANYQLGGAVANEIKRQLSVNSANTSME